VKDERDDRDDRDHRENGTNGDDRKGMWLYMALSSRNLLTLDAAADTPPPAHDDLDIAE
jgi:hypothetical protein